MIAGAVPTPEALCHNRAQRGGEDHEQLSFRSCESFDDRELAEVIGASYEESLDCPGLYGLRKTEDVIASHKAAAGSEPATWLIFYRSSQPVGCVLVNDSSATATADVSYLGVLPKFRGLGFGRAMLAIAISGAKNRDYMAMTLAVDAQNSYAFNLYKSAGFTEIFRKLAFIYSC